MYVVNIEVQVPGDAIDNGEQLRAALEDAQEGAPFPRILVDEAKSTVLVALQIDGDDGPEAAWSALELLSGAWEEAFDDAAPSELLIMRTIPWNRRATVAGLILPVSEGEREDGADEDELEPVDEAEDFDPTAPLAE